MLHSFTELAKQHWVIGGIFSSLIWLLAGKQSLSNGNPRAALGWQSVGIFVILVVLGWTIAEGEWLGSACSILVLCFEVQAMRQTLAAQKGRVANP